jgi:hypothetical protein
MSKWETDLTRWYWEDQGRPGTLYLEFRAQSGATARGQRLLDGLILHGGAPEIASERVSDPSIIRGHNITVVQTKYARFGMYLAGQTLFSLRLLEQYRPREITSVAVCINGDDELERLLRDVDPRCSVVIPPHDVVQRTRAAVDIRVNELEAQAREVWQSIILGARLPPSELPHVPRTKGIYAWFDLATGEPVYIGSAASESGLRKRILHTHLDETCFEKRETEFTSEDEFQLTAALNSLGNRWIDKSVLRRNVARAHRLAPGNESTSYLKNHFLITWVELPHLEKSAIQRIEKLIRRNLGRPLIYNRAK